ncbi:MAG: hypothetical protein K0Q54_1158 [Methylobacterium brachiatum]|nr:hypothetical protein [Methylobacterium brachiatum]
MSSPVLSVVSTLGLVAGQAGELSDRDLALGALGVDGLNGGVEDAHRHGHVARMRGDAGVAAADDHELPA